MSALTRRAVLGASACGATGLLLSQWAWPIGSRRSATRADFLYEPVLDQHLLFRDAAMQDGFVTRKIDGDVGAIAMVYDKIWRTEPDALFGFTSPATAFIMQQLAMRRGMAFSALGPGTRSKHQPDNLMRVQTSRPLQMVHGQLWQISRTSYLAGPAFT